MTSEIQLDRALRLAFGSGESDQGETLDDRSAAPLPARHGKRLGDFELLAEIGRGGMGVVYRARQRSLKREVALKMIRGGELASRAELVRFRGEAEAVSQLDHPHIVPIYDIGEQDGRPWYSMKLIEGSDLSHALEQWRERPRSVATLVATIADAVQHAHERGFLHRDLKPANILLDRRGKPHITDFGLAKRLEQADKRTLTGQVVGTVSFMSPEQARGDRVLTTGTDVYSLGAILYTLLTGRPPFEGSDLATLRRVVEEEPQPPSRWNPAVDRELQTICQRCLAKHPAQRYSTAGALAADLRRWLNHEPIEARPAGSLDRLVKLTRRNPLTAALAASLIALLLAGTAISTTLAIRFRNASEAQRIARVAAEAARQEALWNLYVARLYTMVPPWEREEYGQLYRMLDATVPSGDAPDFRGWEWHYLRDVCNQRTRTLPGDQLPRTDVAWNADGTLLACTRLDQGVEIRDGVTGTVRFVLPRAGDGGVFWSPDGRRLATLSAERFRVWEVESRRRVADVPAGELDRLSALDYRDDGRRLAVGGVGRIGIFDHDGRLLRTLDVNRARANNKVAGLDWHPDGRRIATASQDGYFRILDSDSGGILQSRRVSNIACTDVAWSPAGDRLAFAAGWPGHKLHIFDEQGRPLHTLDGHDDYMTKVTWNPRGTLLATSGRDHAIRLWNVEEGSLLRQLRLHDGLVESVAWSPDGQRIASVSDDGRVRVTAVGATDSGLTIDVEVTAAAWGPGGSTLVTGGKDRLIHVWDALTGEPVQAWSGHRQWIGKVAIHPDGSTIASVCRGGELRVWDAASGKLLHVLDVGSGGQHLSGMEFSPDGRYLAVGSSEVASQGEVPPVLVWDTRDYAAAPIEVERRHSATVTWNSDGTRLALAGGRAAEATVYAWPERRRVWQGGPRDGSACLEFSPDDRLLAVASKRGEVALYESETGRLVFTLRNHSAAVDRVRWSPGGSRLATGSRDGIVKIWDAATGDELLALRLESVGILRWSPDGRRLAVGSRHVRILGSSGMPPRVEARDRLLTGRLTHPSHSSP